jgi:hypothetical protein
MNALMIEPPPSATMLVSPNRMIAKYSGESNLSANAANGCTMATATRVDTRPPVSAANSVHPNALAGLPLCAIA